MDLVTVSTPEDQEIGLSDLVRIHNGPAIQFDADGRAVAISDDLAREADADGDWLALLSIDAWPPAAGHLSVLGYGVHQRFVRWATVASPPGGIALFGIDVTLESRMRLALAESRQRFRDMTEVGVDIAWETDADGLFTYVSAAPELGLTADDLLGAPAERVLAAACDGVSPFSPDRPIRDLPVWVQLPGGGTACLSVSARPVLDETGEWRGARGVGRNVTDRQRTEGDLARLHQRDHLVGCIADAMRRESEPQAALVAALTVIVRTTGADGGQLLRRSPSGDIGLVAHVVPDRSDVVLDFSGVDGLIRECAVSIGPVRRSIGDDHVVGLACRHGADSPVVVVLRRRAGNAPWRRDDLALLEAGAPQLAFAMEQVAQHERLKRQAERDPLTGLYNRAAVERRIAEALERLTPPGGALLYADLDNFKAVNDRRGHAHGDTVLRAVSAIFDEHLGPVDIAGRMGGDEFVLFLAQANATKARDVGDTLVEAGHRLNELSAGTDLPLGLSIGVVPIPAHWRGDLDALIEQADQAMYRAKRLGKTAGLGGACVLVDPDAQR